MSGHTRMLIPAASECAAPILMCLCVLLQVTKFMFVVLGFLGCIFCNMKVLQNSNVETFITFRSRSVQTLSSASTQHGLHAAWNLPFCRAGLAETPLALFSRECNCCCMACAPVLVCLLFCTAARRSSCLSATTYSWAARCPTFAAGCASLCS